MQVKMYTMLFAVTAIVAGYVGAQSPCKTPDGLNGQCIDLYSCPHLLEQMRPPSPLTKEVLGNILKSGCDEHNSMKVCCGSKDESEQANPEKVKRNRRDLSCGTGLPDPSSGCCGVDAGTHKIFSTQAGIDMYPWLVLIEYAMPGGKPKTLCTGTLINRRYVLTTAHCVNINKNLPTSVRLGEYNLATEGPDCVTIDGDFEDCSDGAISIGIEKIIVHPTFNVKNVLKGHDIALIRLKELAPFTDFIRPICLPATDMTVSEDFKGFKLIEAGWNLFHNKFQGNIKLHEYMYYVNSTECKAIYSEYRKKPMLENQICARRESRGCIGDSGGPLMYSRNGVYETIGVISYGPTSCNEGSPPDVFTKVYAFKDWISSNIEA